MASGADRLREVGLKVTGPRLWILAALETRCSHPSADELFARLRARHPSLSLSTVYKTLEAFLRAGLCRRVNAEGSLRVDGTPHPHDHAVCRGCGRIFDIDRSHAALRELPKQLPRGLAVEGFRIEYDVVCSRCRAQRRIMTTS